MQDAKNVRTDVLVLNTHHIFVDREYLDVRLKERNIDLKSESLSNENTNLFVKDFVSKITENYPDIPIYVALTVYSNYIKSIKDNLYLSFPAHSGNWTFEIEAFDKVAIDLVGEPGLTQLPSCRNPL